MRVSNTAGNLTVTGTETEVSRWLSKRPAQQAKVVAVEFVSSGWTHIQDQTPYDIVTGDALVSLMGAL